MAQQNFQPPAGATLIRGWQAWHCHWQCTVTGDGATDVAYALSSPLTVSNRREWERDLLTIYLEQLRGQIGAAAPDFDSASLSYRRQMMHGLFNWFFVDGAGPLQPSMQPDDLGRINVERMAVAVADLDTLDTIG